jgi:hypothetical protein
LLEKIFLYLQNVGIISIDVRIYALDSTCVKVHPDAHDALKKVESSKPLAKVGVVGIQKFIWSPHLRETQ